ncbi:MAG: indole-3-glycerol phosphate synthase TrpC [Verrucomicrobiota bacterium]|jgi:indole-3-glycerol phosphate synthase|nr:indole-3-glycerol phosphate synthase TrpC [Verrucomicrobiota bacterium]
MTILSQILASKQKDVAQAMRQIPQAEMERRAAARRGIRAFVGAMNKPGIRILAEIKRASPSKGDIHPDVAPADQAHAYEQGGAAALSVLTETHWFKGSVEDLIQARQATALPVLRKDFIFHPYQVYETVVMGADALLLIVRMLSDETLSSLFRLARKMGLAALVEVHTMEDAERISDLAPSLVGINNRNLENFHTDTTHAGRLASLLSASSAVVAASGISSVEDIRRAAPLRRFLVGEALMRAPDPAALLRTWTALPGGADE